MEALHAAIQVTTARGGRVELRASSPVAEHTCTASSTAATHRHSGVEPSPGLGVRLRHPASQRQEDASIPAALDPHAQRVVATLLRELDAARQRGASLEAHLAAMQRQQEQEQRRHRSGPAPSKQQLQGVMGSRRHASTAPAGPAPVSRIKAFRPPGHAPQSRQLSRPSLPPALRPTAMEGQLAALQRENAEMRGHLGALLSHFRQQLESAASTEAAGRDPPPAHTALRSRQRQPIQEGMGPAMLEQQPCSPGRTTAVVLSPRAGGADLAVAVFEAPPEDVVGLRLELNRTQRQNLKLSSKLAKAQQEARERMAEARRWQQAVEQQAGSIAELKVDLEAERRRGQEVEAALTAASEEVAATQQQATALMAQLGAAEAANAAANGEAASLCSQLAVVEEQRGRALAECERLKEDSVGTAARLNASELVRREAERERDSLEPQVQRLRAALAEAEAVGAAQAERLAVQLGAAQQQVAVERQRAEMLQAQLSLVEAQARDTERALSEQLRAVQEERNTCLAAATRADKLLVRLGHHALATRGID